jgi:hypothetical protein
MFQIFQLVICGSNEKKLYSLLKVLTWCWCRSFNSVDTIICVWCTSYQPRVFLACFNFKRQIRLVQLLNRYLVATASGDVFSRAARLRCQLLANYHRNHCLAIDPSNYLLSTLATISGGATLKLGLLLSSSSNSIHFAAWQRMSILVAPAVRFQGQLVCETYF